MMQEKLSDKLWTLPNAITLFRLIFGAPVTLILYHNGYEYAWVIFLFFVFTDWLDGWIARRFKLGSSWGILLDPLADQFLNLPIMWYFVVVGVWTETLQTLTFIFTVREALVLSMRFLMSGDMPAISSGKLKVVAEYFGIALFLWGWEMYFFGFLSFFAAFLFAAWSFVKYFIAFMTEKDTDNGENAHANHSA